MVLGEAQALPKHRLDDVLADAHERSGHSCVLCPAGAMAAGAGRCPASPIGAVRNGTAALPLLPGSGFRSCLKGAASGNSCVRVARPVTAARLRLEPSPSATTRCSANAIDSATAAGVVGRLRSGLCRSTSAVPMSLACWGNAARARAAPSCLERWRPVVSVAQPRAHVSTRRTGCRGCAARREGSARRGGLRVRYGGPFAQRRAA